MIPDLSPIAGAGFIVAIVLPILIVVLSYLLFYLVIRDAIAAGLRKHHLWLELRADREAEQHSRHIAASQQTPFR